MQTPLGLGRPPGCRPPRQIPRMQNPLGWAEPPQMQTPWCRPPRQTLPMQTPLWMQTSHLGWTDPHPDADPPGIGQNPQLRQTLRDADPPRQTPRCKPPGLGRPTPDAEPPGAGQTPWMQTPLGWVEPLDADPPPNADPPGCAEPPGCRRPPIRLTSGRYASYCNAYLFH